MFVSSRLNFNYRCGGDWQAVRLLLAAFAVRLSDRL
jgi:hypothetical protein